MLSARDLPHPGIETTSPAWQADSLLLSYWGNLNLQVTSPRLGLRFLEEFHFVSVLKSHCHDQRAQQHCRRLQHRYLGSGPHRHTSSCGERLSRNRGGAPADSLCHDLEVGRLSPPEEPNS